MICGMEYFVMRNRACQNTTLSPVFPTGMFAVDTHIQQRLFKSYDEFIRSFFSSLSYTFLQIGARRQGLTPNDSPCGKEIILEWVI